MLLAAGAYFSPAILLRSGIGPEADLRRLDIDVVAALPVGERLLDHCGTDVLRRAPSCSRKPRPRVRSGASSRRTPSRRLQARPASVAAGTSISSRGSRAPSDGRFRAHVIVFHMKPLSAGAVRLGSADPTEPPLVERGFLPRDEDLGPLLEGIELAR